MADVRDAFFAIITNPLKFKLFLLSRLPAGFFTGLKVVAVSAGSCTVSVPYKWFNKNPFRSTYFASLAMAAELSTGVLAMAKVYGRKPAVSMLVTGMEAAYFKKATERTFFKCTEGQEIEKAVQAAIKTGEGQVVKVISNGINSVGEPIAQFTFTWSFKVKKKQ
ncbi:MAG: DUF4442 domain-containing protein [Niabella sp.]